MQSLLRLIMRELFGCLYRRATALTAISTAAVFLYAQVAAPLAQASFWSERQKAVKAYQAAHEEHPGARTADALDEIASAATSDPAKASQLLASLPGPNTSVLPTLPANITPDMLPKAALPPQVSPAVLHRYPVLGELPFNYGTMKELQLAPNHMARPLILHLQDVHLNPEAQSNLAAILHTVLAQGKVGVVGVEAAHGAFNFQPFRAFPNPAITKDVAAYLLKRGELGAASYVGITADKDYSQRFWGVDDLAHYRGNVQAITQSKALQPRYQARLKALDAKLAVLKASRLNPALRSLETQVSAYREGTVALGAYVETLARQGITLPPQLQRFLQTYHEEKTLDFTEVENERKALIEQLVPKLDQKTLSQLVAHSIAYRMEQIPYAAYYRYLQGVCTKSGIALSQYPAMQAYVQYVLHADLINAEAMFRELAQAEDEGLAKLTQTPAERQLLIMAKQLTLSHQLVNLSFTPEQWTAWQTVRTSLQHLEERIQGFRTPSPPPSPARGEGDKESLVSSSLRGSEGVITDLTSFERFYLEAEARDEAMVTNLLAQMKATGASTGVLIAGGFHASGIARRMREQQVSYVSLAPKITKLDTAEGNKYLDVFVREKTPLEKLFVGEKLFVKPAEVDFGAMQSFAAPDEVRSVVNYAILETAIQSLGQAVVNHTISETAIQSLGSAKDTQQRELSQDQLRTLLQSSNPVLATVGIPPMSAAGGAKVTYDPRGPRIQSLILPLKVAGRQATVTVYGPTTGEVPRGTLPSRVQATYLFDDVPNSVQNTGMNSIAIQVATNGLSLEGLIDFTPLATAVSWISSNGLMTGLFFISVFLPVLMGIVAIIKARAQSSNDLELKLVLKGAKTKKTNFMIEIPEGYVIVAHNKGGQPSVEIRPSVEMMPKEEAPLLYKAAQGKQVSRGVVWGGFSLILLITAFTLYQVWSGGYFASVEALLTGIPQMARQVLPLMAMYFWVWFPPLAFLLGAVPLGWKLFKKPMAQWSYGHAIAAGVLLFILPVLVGLPTYMALDSGVPTQFASALATAIPALGAVSDSALPKMILRVQRPVSQAGVLHDIQILAIQRIRATFSNKNYSGVMKIRLSQADVYLGGVAGVAFDVSSEMLQPQLKQEVKPFADRLPEGVVINFLRAATVESGALDFYVVNNKVSRSGIVGAAVTPAEAADRVNLVLKNAGVDLVQHANVAEQLRSLQTAIAGRSEFLDAELFLQEQLKIFGRGLFLLLGAIGLSSLLIHLLQQIAQAPGGISTILAASVIPRQPGGREPSLKEAGPLKEWTPISTVSTEEIAERAEEVLQTLAAKKPDISEIHLPVSGRIVEIKLVEDKKTWKLTGANMKKADGAEETREAREERRQAFEEERKAFEKDLLTLEPDDSTIGIPLALFAQAYFANVPPAEQAKRGALIFAKNSGGPWFARRELGPGERRSLQRRHPQGDETDPTFRQDLIDLIQRPLANEVRATVELPTTTPASGGQLPEGVVVPSAIPGGPVEMFSFVLSNVPFGQIFLAAIVLGSLFADLPVLNGLVARVSRFQGVKGPVEVVSPRQVPAVLPTPPVSAPGVRPGAGVRGFLRGDQNKAVGRPTGGRYPQSQPSAEAPSTKEQRVGQPVRQGQRARFGLVAASAMVVVMLFIVLGFGGVLRATGLEQAVVSLASVEGPSNQPEQPSAQQTLPERTSTLFSFLFGSEPVNTQEERLITARRTTISVRIATGMAILIAIFALGFVFGASPLGRWFVEIIFSLFSSVRPTIMGQTLGVLPAVGPNVSQLASALITVGRVAVLSPVVPTREGNLLSDAASSLIPTVPETTTEETTRQAVVSFLEVFNPEMNIGVEQLPTIQGGLTQHYEPIRAGIMARRVGAGQGEGRPLKVGQTLAFTDQALVAQFAKEVPAKLEQQLRERNTDAAIATIFGMLGVFQQLGVPVRAQKAILKGWLNDQRLTGPSKLAIQLAVSSAFAKNPEAMTALAVRAYTKGPAVFKGLKKQLKSLEKVVEQTVTATPALSKMQMGRLQEAPQMIFIKDLTLANPDTLIALGDKALAEEQAGVAGQWLLVGYTGGSTEAIENYLSGLEAKIRGSLGDPLKRDVAIKALRKRIQYVDLEATDPEAIARRLVAYVTRLGITHETINWEVPGAEAQAIFDTYGALATGDFQQGQLKVRITHFDGLRFVPLSPILQRLIDISA